MYVKGNVTEFFFCASIYSLFVHVCERKRQILFQMHNYNLFMSQYPINPNLCTIVKGNVTESEHAQNLFVHVCESKRHAFGVLCMI